LTVTSSDLGGSQNTDETRSWQ